MDNIAKEQALPFWRGDILFASLMFVAACVAFWFASHESGLMLHGYGWPTATFFLAYGIFTITVGYPHPGFGHVSFDRVAQVASILVLGPLDAAWINGLASLIYPWHRLFNNVPFRTVVVASLHNAGMMTLVVLGCGLLYTYLGGPPRPRSRTPGRWRRQPSARSRPRSSSCAAAPSRTTSPSSVGAERSAPQGRRPGWS
jgi:hypothetical protein